MKVQFILDVGASGVFPKRFDQRESFLIDILAQNFNPFLFGHARNQPRFGQVFGAVAFVKFASDFAFLPHRHASRALPTHHEIIHKIQIFKAAAFFGSNF